MTEDRHPTVGILGGMGPEATVDLMRRIIDATPADDDADHIRLLVDNDPRVPSRIDALIEGTGENPAPHLAAMAQGLERTGADVLVIACNTAHHYLADIAGSVDVPVMDMVELAAQHIATTQPNVESVGLLASTALGLVRLYEPAFERRGIAVVHPRSDDQAVVMDLIRSVKAGRATEKQLVAHGRVATALESAVGDTGCLLIACTELSALADELDVTVPVYDASDILARAVVAYVDDADSAESTA